MQEYSVAFRVAFVACLVILPVGAWAHAQDRPDAVQAEVSIGADDRTVTSKFLTNSCGRPLRLEVDQTPRRVEVRTLVDRDWWLASCNDGGISRVLSVTLNEPLNGRELVAVG